MNENADFSNSNKETDLKCSLCKEPLRTEKDEEIMVPSTFFILINVLICTRDWRTFMVKILKILLEINNLFLILFGIKPFLLKMKFKK